MGQSTVYKFFGIYIITWFLKLWFAIIILFSPSSVIVSGGYFKLDSYTSLTCCLIILRALLIIRSVVALYFSALNSSLYVFRINAIRATVARPLIRLSIWAWLLIRFLFFLNIGIYSGSVITSWSGGCVIPIISTSLSIYIIPRNYFLFTIPHSTIIIYCIWFPVENIELFSWLLLYIIYETSL